MGWAQSSTITISVLASTVTISRLMRQEAIRIPSQLEMLATGKPMKIVLPIMA